MHWYWQKLWTRSYKDEFQWISCLPHLSWPVSDEPCFATGAKHIKSVVSEDFPLALWSSPTWHCPSPLHSVSLLPLASPSWRAFLSAPSTRKILQVHSRWGETPAPSHRKAHTLLPPCVLLLSCRSPCSLKVTLEAGSGKGKPSHQQCFRISPNRGNSSALGAAKAQEQELCQSWVMQHFWTLSIYLFSVFEVTCFCPRASHKQVL